jgi:hypothetical protein
MTMPGAGASRFVCVACGTPRDLTEVVYRCACGGLLEVRHDLAASGRGAREW